MRSKDGSSKGLLVRALAMAAMAAVTTASAFAGELISPFKGKISEKALASDSAYSALAGNPATAAIEVVKANPQAVEAGTRTVSLALPSGLRLRVRKVDSYKTESGSLFWSGVILSPAGRGQDFDPLDTLTLVRNGGKVTGNLRYKGAWYQIRPLKNGGHVVVTVDQSRLPSDDPADPLPSVPMAADAAAATNKVNTVIAVLVSYSPAAASAAGDINGLIDLAVAEANQSYANSGVAITLQLVKKARVTYTESNNSVTDLSRYQGTSDGYMDYIHTQRTQYGADVAVLVLASLETGIAGRASGIGSSATTAFAVVHQAYATGNYTFAHEIGHLQSARHDPAADPSTTPYAYGHGYVYTGSPGWRTIMATLLTTSAPRLNYWSNPNKLYNGVPMGTASTHDNARVLNTTAGTVAGFKTASGCIPDGGFDDTLSQTNCCSGYAVSGSTYCTNPADWNNGWASCTHICGSAPVGGCIPSGGIDDTYSSTSCCSGAAISGSTFCNDPADYGDDWTTCAHICQ